MDDPFLPWWLVLLLGMWAAALTLWCHPATHREIRLWAGLATLVYCGMILLALAGPGQSGLSASLNISSLFLFVLMAISVTASVWSLSRFPFQSRHVAYVLLTAANACLCLYWQQMEVGLGLFVIAGLSSWPLVQTFARRTFPPLRELLVQMTQFENAPEAHDNQGEFILIAALTGVAALLLLGTVSYAVRAETSRAISSPRHSMLPSPELLRQVLNQRSHQSAQPGFWHLILGARSDIVVMLTVIVFLNLAMTMTSHAEARSVDPVVAEQDHRLSPSAGEGLSVGDINEP